ncbi:DeoR/GlpR family DNA-binding transcription regulator [Aquabacter sp. P-9]|uniref:DeoR/GlpR family DNA-binding transcription regulator n=1 Tax=Aquabacter sediminis TaxID=3029197 RepID=UPI00237D506B|nr:DeoR/GlpR family DNA-binding transcription regulator [Aquabacter sp. P-9]MDE1567983.1 DeoR/GlpR family DNA-binding transcription regulator [Aquabacter sp. P-9]
MHALNDRQTAILSLARASGHVEVEDLASRFGVTPQTIRRDLNALCDGSLLARTHGGAVVSSAVENLSYEARRQIAAPAKRAIGEAAARLIPDNSSLFITIGTTTEEVARAITGHRDLLVITNNINVALRLYPFPDMRVMVAGGQVRHSDGAVVGPAAIDMIRQFKVDTAIIGASAIDEDGSLLDFDPLEVTVARAIMENARRVILVCDRSKVGRVAPVRLGHLSQVAAFVTDHLPSPRLRALCAAHNVQLVETTPENEHPLRFQL